MKRKLRLVVAMVMMTVLMAQNVCAMPYNPHDYTSVYEESQLLPRGIKRSKVTESARMRGNFFMSADLTIMDNGNGDIGALAVGLTRHPVDEAYITVYLDYWDEANERWRQVKSYEAEFLQADYPEGISEPTVDITFLDNERGYYYRLRGVFAVMYQGKMEAFSPTTDGILID